jgi:hypothetical protein
LSGAESKRIAATKVPRAYVRPQNVTAQYWRAPLARGTCLNTTATTTRVILVLVLLVASALGKMEGASSFGVAAGAKKHYYDMANLEMKKQTMNRKSKGISMQGHDHDESMQNVLFKPENKLWNTAYVCLAIVVEWRYFTRCCGAAASCLSDESVPFTVGYLMGRATGAFLALYLHHCIIRMSTGAKVRRNQRAALKVTMPVSFLSLVSDLGTEQGVHTVVSIVR